jgi:hypothetical protein
VPLPALRQISGKFRFSKEILILQEKLDWIEKPRDVYALLAVLQEFQRNLEFSGKSEGLSLYFGKFWENLNSRENLYFSGESEFD